VIEYNLAVALSHLGRYVEASGILERTSSAAGAEPWVREESASLLAQTREHLAELTVHLQGAPSGVTLTIDGRPYAVGGAVPLDPGAHRVVVARGEEELETREVDLGTGRTLITLALDREAMRTPEASPPALPELPELPRDDSSTLPVWFGGAGLAVGLAGTILFLLNHADVAAYNASISDCQGAVGEGQADCATYQEAWEGDASTAQLTTNAGIAGMVAGGALLATGAVWWVADSGSGHAADEASLHCGVTFSGLACIQVF
jgi:hypothetical protein